MFAIGTFAEVTFAQKPANEVYAVLSGASSLTFSTTANLVGTSGLIGSTDLTFSTAASLVGDSALSASTTFTFTSTAILSGAAALSASTTLTFSTSADLIGVSALSGSTTLTFSTSGITQDANFGGRIVGGQFKRGQWRAIEDAKRATKEAEERAKKLKRKRAREAAEQAAREARAAIEASRLAQDQDFAAAEQFRAMTAALQALAGAQTITQQMQEANSAMAHARAIQEQIAANDDDEAIAILLLTAA